MVFLRQIDQSIETDRATELLSGPNHIEVLLGNQAEDGVVDPQYIAYLEDLTAFLRTQPHVSSVTSFLDVIEELSRAFETSLDSIVEADQFVILLETHPLGVERQLVVSQHLRIKRLQPFRDREQG